MTNIHWLGAGLSSIPGIRRIALNNQNLTVWNRTLSKAEKCIDHVKSDGVSSKNDTSKTSSIKTYIHPRFSNPNKNFKVKNIRQKIFGRVKNK